MADVAELDAPATADALTPPQGWRRLRQVLGWMIGVAALLLIWRSALAVFQVPAFVMPTPEAVFGALIANAQAIGLAALFTTRNALLGLAVAFALAISLAALFVSSRRLTSAILPVVIALRTAPVLAIAPILIMIFGRGLGAAIAVVVIVSFFPIMVNAMKGFSSTPTHALELMHVLGAGWLKTFARVRAPFALPHIFAGSRSAATSALLAAMLAEWLSGAPGLGSMILQASSFRRSALMWAVVVVSMCAAFAAFSMTSWLERRLTTWRPQPGERQ